MAIAPYDPPPSARSSRTAGAPLSSSRRSSVSMFDRVRIGLQTAEHLADEAGLLAGQVGKAVRTAEKVEDDIEASYGHRDGRSYRGAQPLKDLTGNYDDATTDGDSDDEAKTGLIQRASKTPLTPAVVVPYEPAMSTTRQRKKTRPTAGDSIDGFVADVDSAQETVDDVSDAIEHIAKERSRLTGLPYTLHSLFEKNVRSPPRSPTAEVKACEKLAAHVANAKDDLARAYKVVCALEPRMKALVASSPSSSGASKALERAQKEYDQLTRSYASLLDYVEDHAKEETRQRENGTAEEGLMDRIKDDHPKWDGAKILAQLQTAKKAAQATSLVKVDCSREPYTARWLLLQPFTELDEVLQAIDLAENGIASRKDERTGTWALGSLISAPPSLSRKSKPSKHSLRVVAEHEVGKRRYRSEGKQSRRSGGAAASPDAAGGAPVQEMSLAKGEDSDDSFDANNLPERVPTDDTSGYVESREELIEDAKAQRRTEHLYTPLLIVYWVSIALLYLYYLIARLLGFESPLGNVDLGSHFGNSAWNDTSDGLVWTSAAAAAAAATSTPSPSPSPGGPKVLTGLPRETSLEQVLRTASSLEAVLAAHGAMSAVGARITAMAINPTTAA
ncbi:hypothetical protein JCM3770_007251 [Rhodotorula araucariae]